MIRVMAATQLQLYIYVQISKTNEEKIKNCSRHDIGHLISGIQTLCVLKTIKSCAKF
jgi:hypothetical protein